MHKTIKYFSLLIAVLIIAGCSTKKNTSLTRAYHNLTSRYNILFNGNESFKSGMIKLEEAYKDDFTNLLPIFLYSNDEAIAGISSDMDISIKKATKLISMHSLTVKPKLKPDQELNEVQKEFYNKKEYNQWVDEAYILMGKGHFYKKEYSQAKETFNYVISNFGENPTVYEAKLWLARLADEEGRFRESEDYLSGLSKTINPPKKLQGDLFATWADFYLKQEKYEEAIVNLKKAIENTKRKKTVTRYHFILAQLYAKNGENELASTNFEKVVRMNPPYEMTFNAKINRALTYQAGDDKKDIEKQLQKMLKDDKNKDFQDQIYFALAQLAYKDKDNANAIKYYKLSLEYGLGNEKQRALTCITLADMYYAMPNYIDAQAYYDSAVVLITPDYPNYESITAKSISLNGLVMEMHTVQFEDSVLTLSYKSKDDLNVYIDELIQKQAEEEYLQRQRQMEIEQERNELLAQSATTNQPISDGSNNWYFYNPTTRNIGHKEFIAIWGNRKLEDNWRRKNKSAVSFSELQVTDSKTGGETEGEQGKSGEVIAKNSRQYYLKDIPLTDSARAVSNTRISESMYKIGIIYGDELKDYPRANETLENLLKRYPQFEEKLETYYKLYTLARNNKDIDRVGKYQQKIISEFPNSNYARLMTNPNFIEELRAKEREAYDFYEQTFALFKEGNYSQVADLAERGMKQFTNPDLYPKFDYMYTISAGLKKDTLSFITDLQALISRYPRSDMAVNAQQMLNYLQITHPEIVEKQIQEVSKELYSPGSDEIHYFAFLLPATVNINQLVFNLISFNLDNFDELKLDVHKTDIKSKNSLCMVRQFNNAKEAMDYLQKAITAEEIYRDIDRNLLTPLVISQSNFNRLSESGKEEEYLRFFRDNYR